MAERKTTRVEKNADLAVEPVTEEVKSEFIEPVKIDYTSLDKTDLVRLLKNKDAALESYEAERKSKQDNFNKNIEDLNNYYTKRIKELKSLIKYYERKYNLIKTIIDIEKDEEEER